MWHARLTIIVVVFLPLISLNGVSVAEYRQYLLRLIIFHGVVKVCHMLICELFRLEVII